MDATFLSKRHNRCLILLLIIILGITVILSMATSSGLGSYNNLQDIDVLGTTTTADNQAEAQQAAPAPSSEQPAVNLTDYEATILYLLNTVRAENGLAALTANQSLTDISRTRSSDMLSRDYFSHYTPEGKNVFSIMRECGIQYSAAGENLAHSRPPDIGTPEAFLNAWMNSSGHAKNILQSRFGIIGVGMIENGARRVVTTVFRNP